MKYFTHVGAALIFLFVCGCDDGNVTTDEVIGSCNLISGTYSGSYSDNSCNGTSNNGTITNFTITDGCGADVQGFIVSANGSVTNINPEGTSFDVRVNTPPGSNCGGLTGHCNQASPSPATYDCTYNWDNGGNGSIHVVKH